MAKKLEKRTRPGRGSDQYMVRFPDGMRAKVAEMAAQNGRTMNAEIIARLEESFDIKNRIEAGIAKLQADLSLGFDKIIEQSRLEGARWAEETWKRYEAERSGDKEKDHS